MNPQNHPFERARAYLDKLPPAISGAGGHDATFRAACWLVRFGLADGDAMSLLEHWNGTHCQPPWTEKELRHKLKDARRVAGYEVRSVTSRPTVRLVWKVEPRRRPEAAMVELAPPAKSEPRPNPGPIPDAVFWDILATWPAAREHLRWRNRPALRRACGDVERRANMWHAPRFRFPDGRG